MRDDVTTENAVLTEDDVMPQICAGWLKRAKELGLPKKGAKRDSDLAAYMQGTLAALTVTGVIEMQRAHMIGFLCAVGRLEQFVIDKAAELEGKE